MATVTRTIGVDVSTAWFNRTGKASLPEGSALYAKVETKGDAGFISSLVWSDGSDNKTGRIHFKQPFQNLVSTRNIVVQHPENGKITQVTMQLRYMSPGGTKYDVGGKFECHLIADGKYADEEVGKVSAYITGEKRPAASRPMYAEFKSAPLNRNLCNAFVDGGDYVFSSIGYGISTTREVAAQYHSEYQSRQEQKDK